MLLQNIAAGFLLIICAICPNANCTPMLNDFALDLARHFSAQTLTLILEEEECRNVRPVLDHSQIQVGIECLSNEENNSTAQLLPEESSDLYVMLSSRQSSVRRGYLERLSLMTAAFTNGTIEISS